VAVIATALVLTPPTIARRPFEPTKGAVFGNINTLEQMSPRVVLHYLAQCANVTGYDTLEDSDCLYTNYIDEQFPGSTWGNKCSPPDITLESIATSLAVAAGKCSDDIENELLETASISIMQVFAMDTCWVELCEREDIHLRLESEWIETCSGVELPYPAESAMSMFPTEDEKEDSILTCMLDFIMDTPPSQFGLEDPPSRCYPPGYQTIAEACSSVLAQQAFESCIGLDYFNEEDDMKMSFDYEMSMKSDQDDEKEELMLFTRFCDILEGLSMERGLKCLEQICQDEVDSSPSSAAPFFAPSSKAPTPPPTKRPTPAPTKRPTPAPTKGPTPAPGSPSASPTLSGLQSIVEVEVVSAFALNMSTSGVPASLQITVESSIGESLSNGGDDVVVTITSVNGNPVTRRLRRLQNVVELEFTVKAIKECYVSNCARFATNVIENLATALANSVTDGSMTVYIQQEAATRNIAELTSAVVIPNSYRYIRSKSQLTDPVVITNPEVVHSSAALVPTVSIFGLSCLIVPFLVI
jgi:hypothetical protein